MARHFLEPRPSGNTQRRQVALSPPMADANFHNVLGMLVLLVPSLASFAPRIWLGCERHSRYEPADYDLEYEEFSMAVH